MLKRVKNERGQALLEFIMLLPILLTFLWYLVHTSVAINKSIVGQKHTRSQLFLKLFNHQAGPVASDYANTDRAHFYIGVSSDATGQTKQPKAPIEVLGVGQTPKKIKEAKDEPGEPEPGSIRQRIRVRTAFGICTHRKPIPGIEGARSDFCGTGAEGLK